MHVTEHSNTQTLSSDLPQSQYLLLHRSYYSTFACLDMVIYYTEYEILQSNPTACNLGTCSAALSSSRDHFLYLGPPRISSVLRSRIKCLGGCPPSEARSHALPRNAASSGYPHNLYGCGSFTCEDFQPHQPTIHCSLPGFQTNPPLHLLLTSLLTSPPRPSSFCSSSGCFLS
ncbi:hypothetical protein P167DRAFT_192103 [Morchella conica CCBAS932]|uniref:Uncharacterized protein n=1 Tax=Morchella conica CCBAS932 TaxID=1392247 RepID=A0A3N4L1R5_9PEZI|nr:hypothetical protein P167DRAFT_192103 [Morchella conica CCBAS932]